MLADTPEAELRTHLIPLVIVGVIGAAIGGWHVWAGGTPLPAWWPWLMYYAALGLLLFGCSSLYHLAKVDLPQGGGNDPPRVVSMNKLDHTGIHVMIAGTGTLHMAILPSIKASWVPYLLVALWALAAIGVAYRFRVGNNVNKLFMGAVYAVMLLMILLSISGQHLWAGPMCFMYAALAVYGASFYAFMKKRHVLWHVGGVIAYVLAGVPIIL